MPAAIGAITEALAIPVSSSSKARGAALPEGPEAASPEVESPETHHEPGDPSGEPPQESPPEPASSPPQAPESGTALDRPLGPPSDPPPGPRPGIESPDEAAGDTRGHEATSISSGDVVPIRSGDEMGRVAGAEDRSGHEGSAPGGSFRHDPELERRLDAAEAVLAAGAVPPGLAGHVRAYFAALRSELRLEGR